MASIHLVLTGCVCLYFSLFLWFFFWSICFANRKLELHTKFDFIVISLSRRFSIYLKNVNLSVAWLGYWTCRCSWSLGFLVLDLKYLVLRVIIIVPIKGVITSELNRFKLNPNPGPAHLSQTRPIQSNPIRFDPIRSVYKIFTFLSAAVVGRQINAWLRTIFLARCPEILGYWAKSLGSYFKLQFFQGKEDYEKNIY